MSACCLACGYNELNSVRRYRSKTHYGRALFQGSWLEQCVQCGLVQAVPHPTLKQLTDYYLEDYRRGCLAGADVADVEEFPKDNLFYFNRGQSIADLLKSYVPDKRLRILDVGAGYGHILHTFRQRHPDSILDAIEFSEDCVDHLKSVGFRVLSRPAEAVLPNMREQFDVIILSHVLEHLLTPAVMLQLIRDSLVPGGILYVEVPNIPADSLRRYPDNVWAPRFDEPHIAFFSVPTLLHLLETTGFQVQFCDTAGSEYKFISALRFHLPHGRWFLQKLVPKTVFNFMRRHPLTKRFRVKEREDSFYQYGGGRIWIRSISKK